MYYTIQPGDTLSTLAQKFYGDARRFPIIATANSIAATDTLQIGAKLLIPDLPNNSPVPTISNPVSHLNEQKFASLHPTLAARGRAMIELCAQSAVNLLVTQGLRTWEQQDQLYAKGRTGAPIGKEYVVTNAKGGRSYHNFGLAFDIVVLDAIAKADWDENHPGWKTAAQIGKSVGLEWGGDWKSFKDLPHFQYTGGMTLARCRELFTDGLPAIWAEVV